MSGANGVVGGRRYRGVGEAVAFLRSDDGLNAEGVNGLGVGEAVALLSDDLNVGVNGVAGVAVAGRINTGRGVPPGGL